MTKTIVHVMRHGEVDNPQGILYGRRPGFSLTAHGKKMTAGVADHFKQIGADIRAVVASPLLRAQESAAPTAKAYGLPVLTDKRLVEAGNSFEGVAVNANRKSLAQPKYWWRYRNVFEPSWGEPYTEIARRMVAGVAHAKALAEGGEALVVSHQLPIWTLRRFVEGHRLWHDPRKRQCSLASLTSFTFEDDTLVALTYSEPVGYMLSEAADMVPGESEAKLA
ncbi:histidine phosphatase family protein [Winkia sp. UMB10116]|uniref:histidine phosphatase family protein n=1 Tax=Winkia TaxID=2692118 RepID=UPI000C802A77|nr:MULTISPECIES: histidine phosphatase family protein [Winkia]MDK6240303.1 histidine phosphatase family protein [Winkia sp. UMB10116]MDU2269699.1 histidine phosphatase family protein [Winkia neuii]MDU5161481.1 histidine phosphatase family protein [Winkia neuii]PMC93839.1 histidine phosphatase family protein [Actinomyces sp. UMB0918]